jgi:hypothetical protein
MLCAAGLLVVVMMTVFVRLGTTHILVKRAHMDNFITKTVLYGNGDLQMLEPMGENNKIDWEKAYPFADIDGGKKIVTLPTKKIESKAASVEKKIDEWTGKHLLGYYKLAEAGRGYEQKINWSLISPAQEIVPLGDGAWSFAYPKVDIGDKTAAIADLAQNAEENGAQFLYIQAPFKVDPYGDFAVNGRVDFTNQNCDDLLAQLKAKGIATMDLRQDLHRWALDDHVSYHDYFFRTDHHWKPETALRAAKVVGDKLREYDIPVDDSHYDLQAFDVEVLPDYFLGSQGKRATLSRTTPDDFSILHPKFPTEITLDIPEKNLHDSGDFELVYDKKQVEKCDYYNLSPYAMYGYGDMPVMDIENLLMPPTDKKVLIIRDSFCDTMAPMLSLGIRNLMTIDVRHFTGSVKNYIAVHKPDVVIVMYTEVQTKPIDWQAHTDKYDFR